jgi:hypothetical protein
MFISQRFIVLSASLQPDIIFAEPDSSNISALSTKRKSFTSVLSSVSDKACIDSDKVLRLDPFDLYMKFAGPYRGQGVARKSKTG